MRGLKDLIAKYPTKSPEAPQIQEVPHRVVLPLAPSKGIKNQRLGMITEGHWY